MRSIALSLVPLAWLSPMPALAQTAQTPPPDATTSTSSAAPSETTEVEPEPVVPVLTISTDRPSFSDGVGIVPPGHFQLESGWTLTYRDDDSAESTRNDVPELLVRYGILENRFELRIQAPNYNWASVEDSDGDTTDVDGWSDMAIGAKLRLVDQKGFVPTIALGGNISVPTGSEEYSSRHVDVIGKFIWNYDLGHGFGLGGNANLNYPSVRDGDHWIQGQGSVYVTYSPRWDWSFFLEYYAIAPIVDGGGTTMNIDFGGAYLINRRMQIDARIGFGLTEESDDVYVGAGFSVLF